MARGNVVEVVFRSVDQMSAGLRGINSQLRTIGRTSVDVDNGLRRVALAASIAFGASVKSALGFEKTLSEIVGLVGVSRSELRGMTEELKNISVATGRGPNELAEALFFITSAGARGSKAMDVLRASAQAATAGLGTTASVADAVTSAVNAYGEATLSADEATNVLVATVREGKAAADSIGGSLGRIVAVANDAGVSFDQVGATIAALTRIGLSADRAVTGLDAILRVIARPNAIATKELEKFGLSARELRRIVREEGLLAALNLLKERIGDNETALRNIFIETTGAVAMLALTGENAEQVEGIFESLVDAIGALESSFGAAAETGSVKLSQSLSELNIVGIELADNTLPTLIEIVTQFGRAVSITSEVSASFGETLGRLFAGSDNPAQRMANELAEVQRRIEELEGLDPRLETGDPLLTDVEGTLATLRAREEVLRTLIDSEERFTANAREAAEAEAERQAATAAATEELEERAISAAEALTLAFDTEGAPERLIQNVGFVADELREVELIPFGDSMVAQWSKSTKAADAFGRELDTIREQGLRNLQDSLADFLFDPFEDGLKGMLRGFIDVVRRMAAEAAAAQIFENLFKKDGSSGGGGFGGFVQSVFGSLIGDGKAHGGFTTSGLVHPIEEREPEFLITPSRSQVVPLSKAAAVGMSGGSGGVVFAPQTTFNVTSPISRDEMEQFVAERDARLLSEVRRMQREGDLP